MKIIEKTSALLTAETMQFFFVTISVVLEAKSTIPYIIDNDINDYIEQEAKRRKKYYILII